jgi:hypothetical protein
MERSAVDRTPRKRSPVSVIAAEGFVEAPREQVFEFLSRLENHWRLADPWIEVLSLDKTPDAPADAPADRGRVRMRGPLGLSRIAATEVVAADPPSSLAGLARVGERTRAAVSWDLSTIGEATHVWLAAQVETASPLDRLILALGGRQWMRRRFELVLANLTERFASGETEAPEALAEAAGQAVRPMVSAGSRRATSRGGASRGRRSGI